MTALYSLVNLEPFKQLETFKSLNAPLLFYDYLRFLHLHLSNGPFGFDILAKLNSLPDGNTISYFWKVNLTTCIGCVILASVTGQCEFA